MLEGEKVLERTKKNRQGDKSKESKIEECRGCVVKGLKKLRS